MTLRRRLMVAAMVLVAVMALAGVLLVRSVEATEIGQADEQITTLLASPALPLFIARGALSVGKVSPVRGKVVPPSKTPSKTGNNSGAVNGNSGATAGNSGAPSALSGASREVRSRPEARISAFSVIGDVYVATIENGKRTIVAKPDSPVTGSPQTPGTTTNSGPVALGLRFTTVGSLSGSGSWRAIVLSVAGKKELVAVSLGGVDATVNRVRLAVIGAGVLALLVLFAAGLWVSRLGLRPIAEVAEVADGITAGDRRRRVSSVRQGTEAGHLARAFNVMLDEQQSIEARLRQFVADASHELRTPLSVIRGIAGLWRQGELRNGASADDAMRRIGQEGARMAKLVEDLLLLAHLDEGQPLERRPVDLVALVRGVLNDVATTHPSRTVTLDAEQSAVVIGDEIALRRVVVNLVSNALAHTPTAASVLMRVTGNAAQTTLEVLDSGPGMTKEGADHAFDRFWRADSSRSRPGNGLGLSIVAGIVADSGGKVSLDSSPERGTIVKVVLPSRSDEEGASEVVQSE